MSPSRSRAVALVGRVAAALLILAAVLALTWWGTGTPRAVSRDVAPTAVPAPAAGIVYACPAAPNNTIGGVDIDETSGSTVITALDPDSTLSYAAATGTTAEATPEATAEATAGASAGATAEATPGATAGATAEATAGASAGASAGATAGATAEASAGAAAGPTAVSAELGGSTTMDSATGGILTVQASGGTPTGAVGVVTTVTAGGDLRGLTVAPCAAPTSVAWIVGGSAAIGSSSELRLTNPGITTVTATIHLYGSTGELTLPASGQVSVGAGETVGVLLETASALDDRLALSVEAEGGSLIPVLVTESLDGETPAGVDTLTAGAAPATEQAIPGVVLVDAAAQGETEAESGAVSSEGPAVRVVNPGAAPATVSISLIGADDEEELPGATAATVDPGAVFDFSLAGVSPGAYAVRVSADAPVGAAVRLVRSAGEYPDRSGALAHDIAWVQAAVDAAEGAALALPRGAGLETSLVLTNTAQTAASLTLASADGQWTQDVEVPAATTLTPEVPQDVSALVIAGTGGGTVLAAAVVTTEVEGDVPGTLIAVVPTVPDAAAQGSRSLLLY
ncbi:DUF5719 family protein [Actinomyces procaprae]|uniref:DUF5719 family protein n=1 Tax=Actinomyces procaprae TaxID=2560010 RepID=UPI0010A2A828|nr:DUF5719 family protein [Actinomyces procaprae]